MGDYYTEIFGKAPKAGTIIPGGGTVLKEVVVTPKRPRKYRFDRRVSTIGPGHDVISETLYDEYSDGQYMGDLSGVAGQRTIYVTPFGNDTIYGRTRNWQGGEPNRLLETGTGFMEVAPDRKDQARRKRLFLTNLKSSHVSPNSSKDEKSAYKRAIKEKQTGGNLSKPKLVSKQQNKQSKLKFVSKDQATKDSIEANVYNNQTVQDTKPGNYEQKNGKTVWVPDRTKYPYKKQMGGDLILKGQDGLKGLWRNTKEFVKGLGSFSELPAPVRYDNDPNTYSLAGIYKYRWSPLQKEWEMVRGFDGIRGTKNYKGRNPKYLGISVPNAAITPSSSTFSSYNDGTTELRNDGTVWHKGIQIK